MNPSNPEVEAFVGRLKRWRPETERLRQILLDCGLGEELKWGKPCYTHAGSNLAIIQGFKGHCALMFFKGALLDDAHDVLVPPGPNSRAAMRIEFTSASDVDRLEPAIRDYVAQAIVVEEVGRRVPPPSADALEFPAELTAILDENPELSEAFHALTPGRQRGYLMHFSSAKQSKTRVARIERAAEKILAGRGLQDR